MNQERLKKIRENLILLLKSTFDMQERSTALIRKEAMDELDNFTLLCHADLLGLPIPTSYYTLEMLPYLAEELDQWERRILSRKNIFEDRWGDFCC